MSGSGDKERPVFVCVHVFNQTRPVLLVSRVDGDWQFLCGGSHDENEVPKVVGMNHFIEIDPTLLDVGDLPTDWEAERSSIGDTWRRRDLSPE